LGVASLALAFWRDVCDRCARRQYLGLHCSGGGSYVAQILHAKVEECATVALHHGAICSPFTTEHCRISHMLASADGVPNGTFHFLISVLLDCFSFCNDIIVSVASACPRPSRVANRWRRRVRAR